MRVFRRPKAFSTVRWKENGQMPLPLAFAFSGMAAARKMHSLEHTSRPLLLRRIYFARLAVYGTVAVLALPFRSSPSFPDIDSVLA